MYEIDSRDKVIELAHAPKPDVGAPLPVIISDENNLLLAYITPHRDPNWDGTSVNIVTETSADEPIAIARFRHPYAHMSGPPNDEAFQGHPLASRGLRPYSVFEIEDSSWIRKLERMNSVHPQHQPQRYRKRKHFIFAFHDSTFECIADGFDVGTTKGSIAAVRQIMLERLGN